MVSLFSSWLLSSTKKPTGAECIEANDHRLASELFADIVDPLWLGILFTLSFVFELSDCFAIGIKPSKI